FLLMIFCCKLGRGSGERYFFFALACLFSVSLDLLVGNRAALLNFVYLLIAAAAFHKKFTAKVFVVGVLGVVFFGAAKTYRDYALHGVSSLVSASKDWYFGDSPISITAYYIY